MNCKHFVGSVPLLVITKFLVVLVAGLVLGDLFWSKISGPGIVIRTERIPMWVQLTVIIAVSRTTIIEGAMAIAREGILVSVTNSINFHTSIIGTEPMNCKL